MSASLRDLLFTMRQHPAFPELLQAFDGNVAEVKQFRPSKHETPHDQYAEWIYRSGQNAQQRSCRDFLVNFDPLKRGGSETSQQEKP